MSLIPQKFKVSFQEASSTAQWPPRTSPLMPAGPRADAGGYLATLAPVSVVWPGRPLPQFQALGSWTEACWLFPELEDEGAESTEALAAGHSQNQFSSFFSLCTGEASPKLIIASMLTHKCISMRPSNPQQGPHGDRDSLGGCWDPPWPRPVALCCGQGGPLAGRRGVRLTGFPARCKCSDSPCDSGPISLADSGARHFSSPHPPTCR